MGKNRWLIMLGLMVAVTPFLGFPLKFKNFLLIIFGLSIAVLAFQMIKIKSNLKPKIDNGVFLDSKQSEAEEIKEEDVEKFEEPLSSDLKENDDNTQKPLNDQENQQF